MFTSTSCISLSKDCGNGIGVLNGFLQCGNGGELQGFHRFLIFTAIVCWHAFVLADEGSEFPTLPAPSWVLLAAVPAGTVGPVGIGLREARSWTWRARWLPALKGADGFEFGLELLESVANIFVTNVCNWRGRSTVEVLVVEPILDLGTVNVDVSCKFTVEIIQNVLRCW